MRISGHCGWKRTLKSIVPFRWRLSVWSERPCPRSWMSHRNPQSLKCREPDEKPHRSQRKCPESHLGYHLSDGIWRWNCPWLWLGLRIEWRPALRWSPVRNLRAVSFCPCKRTSSATSFSNFLRDLTWKSSCICVGTSRDSPVSWIPAVFLLVGKR